MTIKKAFAGLLLSLILALAIAFFNQPRQSPFPFSAALERLPDYVLPGEGVTLYPTGGPFGFDVIETIAVDEDNTLFVGTFGGGIFRTRDNGQTWMPSNRGLADKFIATLFLLKSGKMFAATTRAGLYKSENKGDQWQSANRGLEDTDVKTITQSASGDLYVGTGKGVYLSQDEGASWIQFATGLDHVQILKIVETQDGTLFAATQGLGIYKREPGAERWVSVIPGFSFNGLEERVVRTMTLSKDGTLYAGTLGAGVFRSRDQGLSWDPINNGLESYSIRTLAIDGQGIVYVGTGLGVHYSPNEGEAWTPLVGGMTDIQILTFVINQGGDLYVASASGIFRGKISEVWEPLHEQLLISNMVALDYGPKGLTVGTWGKGTYVNRQDNWMSDNMGFVNLTIRSLARGKLFLYAITNDGHYRRQLGRHQWSRLSKPAGLEVHSIAVGRDDRVFAGTEKGLFSSSDHGNTWNEEEALGTKSIGLLESDGESVFAVSSGEIWAKSAEGEWQNIFSEANTEISLLSWQAKRGLLALRNQKLWERDLQGIWHELETTLPQSTQINDFSVDPKNPNLLYLASDQGLLWTMDHGLSWQKAALYQGEPFEGKINAVLATDSTAVWVASEKDGVILGISKAAQRGFWDDLMDRFSN